MNLIIDNLIHDSKTKLQKLHNTRMLLIDNYISICVKSTFFKYNFKSVTFLKLHIFILSILHNLIAIKITLFMPNCLRYRGTFRLILVY
jgi:hypothetical protein